MSCAQKRKIQQSIINASVAEQLHLALREFSVQDITVYRGEPAQCQCGESITQGHMILNEGTGERLGEFGPGCLLKLRDNHLINDMKALTQMHRLRESLQDPDFKLKLVREQFTPETLWYMQGDGAFVEAAGYTGWFEYKAYRYFDRLLYEREAGSMSAREIRVNDVFLHNSVAEYLRENSRIKTITTEHVGRSRR